MDMLTLFVVFWLPYTKEFNDVVYKKYQNMCRKSSISNLS